MENAVSDGTGGEEREDEDEEGVKESEDEGFSGEDGGLLLKRVAEAKVSFDGESGGLGEELIDDGVDGEGEGKRE